MYVLISYWVDLSSVSFSQYWRLNPGLQMQGRHCNNEPQYGACFLKHFIFNIFFWFEVSIATPAISWFMFVQFIPFLFKNFQSVCVFKSQVTVLFIYLCIKHLL